MSETAEQPVAVPDETIHPIAPPAPPPPVEPTPPLRPIDIVRRRSRLARRSIVVPEWEMTVWFGKLTVSDMEATGAREAKSTLERNLVLLTIKAEDEAGAPLFASGDLHFLKQEADFVVIQRLLDFMFASAAGLPTPLEEADRIAASPPSGSA